MLCPSSSAKRSDNGHNEWQEVVRRNLLALLECRDAGRLIEAEGRVYVFRTGCQI
jgi:hypothetical protein